MAAAQTSRRGGLAVVVAKVKFYPGSMTVE